MKDLRPQPGDHHPPWRVVVSYVGDVRRQLGIQGPLVTVDPGKTYRWDWLRGLWTTVIVQPGIDCRDGITAAFNVGALYPLLIDIESGREADILSLAPFRLCPLRRAEA